MADSLSGICRTIRKDILSIIYSAGSGHLGASLSVVEILAALYFTGIFKNSPENPQQPGRDRFVMSKGHAVPALYSVLAHLGYLEISELDSLRRLGSRLQGHPRYLSVPGIDYTAGSLGQGLSVANGLAIGYKRQKLSGRIYCLVGDGELQEGQIWEAALTAAQFKLSNVCVIVDNNHVQLDGLTKFIKNVDPISGKWKSFGWNVITAQGHCVKDMERAYTTAANHTAGPSVIVAETVKGKGISFMENNCEWHSNPPSIDELVDAIAQLDNI